MRKINWTQRFGVALFLGVMATWLAAWALTTKPLERVWAWPLARTSIGWYDDAEGNRVEFRVETVETPGQEPRYSVGSPEQFELMSKALSVSDDVAFCWLSQFEFRYGFPAQAMAFDTVLFMSEVDGKKFSHYELKKNLDIKGKATQGFPWNLTRGGTYRFPTAILLPGFLVDTIFWAIVALGLMNGPGILRRYRRKKNGLCVPCGYNLMGNTSGVCPECGEGT